MLLQKRFGPLTPRAASSHLIPKRRRYVRQQNSDILGETTDLDEFPFGSERASLAVVRPMLMDLQHGDCFYCRARLTEANIHGDHFIPWARYPVDLGHNFVLADSR